MIAIKTVFLLLLTLVAFAPTRAIAADDDPAVAQFSKAAKVYLRDSAEFPLNEKVEVTFTDRKGRVRKHKTAKYKYHFHGYNIRANKGKINMEDSWRTELFGGPVKKAVYATSFSTLLPSVFLYPDVVKNATIAPGASPDLVTIAIPSGGDCDPFQWDNEHYISRSFCGSFEAKARKDDFELKHSTFEAGRFPVPAAMDVFGLVNILRYHVEMEFQKVFLPGDSNPFLMPKLVTVTVETDKGKLVMTGNYTTAKITPASRVALPKSNSHR